MPGAETRQLGAQQVDGQHGGGDGVVSDLGIRVRGGDLRAAHDMPVLGMAQQETGHRPLRVFQIGEQARGIAAGAQGLLIGFNGFFGAFAQPGFQLFLGHIPDPRAGLRAVPIQRQRPVIKIGDQAAQRGHGHCAIDSKTGGFIGIQRVTQIIDKITVRLNHQR